MQEYKVVCRYEHTPLGGGPEKIIKIGSRAECDAVCARLTLQAREAASGSSVGEILMAACTYTVELKEPGDQVSWSQ